jgi:CRISPR-associated protein Csx1
MKLLVSTWGLPTNWSDSTYEFNGSTSRACTTLKLLHKNYDRSIVIVLDSLIDVAGKGREDSQCAKCFYSHKSDFTQGTYAELVEKVKETVSGTLDCLGIQNADVMVLPATGSPAGNWRFNGNMMDYISVGLMGIYEYIKNQEDLDEIALDLTHGINFMPALSFRMVQIISQLAFLNNESQKRVKFVAYNSDPFTSKCNLNINRVHSEIITSVEIPKHLPSKMFLPNHPKGVFSDMNKLFANEINPIISSVFYPLPLALSSLAKNRFSIDPMKIWKQNVSIDGATVNREVSLDPVAINAMILSHILNEKVDFGCSIESLKVINERIYKRISPVEEVLIGNELEQIGRQIDEYQGDFPITLDKLMVDKYGNNGKYAGVVDKGASDSQLIHADKRVMIAHAGLQKEFVKLESSRKVIYVGEAAAIMKGAGLILN